MKGLRLFEEMTYLEEDLLQDAYAPKTHIHLVRKVALVAVMVSLLAVSVFAAAISRTEIVATPVEDGYTVTFQTLDLRPVDVGYWYPQELPKDYEAHWIGSNEGNRQSMNFICDRRLNFKIGDEGLIYFTYGAIRNLPAYNLEYVTESRSLQVGEHQAQLFQNSSETIAYVDGKLRNVTVYQEWLFWVDSERKLGFVLRFAGYTPVDLVAMAESVAKVEELAATFESDAGAAVMKLGNYDLQWLPEDYAYVATYGQPAYPLTADLGKGYVHKVYRDPEFRELHLYYEYIPKGCTSAALEYVEDLKASDVDLGGVSAVYYEAPNGEPYAIVWQREDTAKIALTFTIRTDSLPVPTDIAREDLLRAAESVVLIQKADTTVLYGTD